MNLTVVPGLLTICRLPADGPIPAWIDGSPFFSITRTATELSIVCPEAAPPREIRRNSGWRALRIAGPLDLDLIGVLLSIAQPLADAGIGIFAVSTFDTDYILVKSASLSHAIAALSAEGHTVEE